jgi:hypothetical protein
LGMILEAAGTRFLLLDCRAVVVQHQERLILIY